MIISGVLLQEEHDRVLRRRTDNRQQSSMSSEIPPLPLNKSAAEVFTYEKKRIHT